VNVTFVDPIAATANLTRAAIFRPDVPAIGSDPRSLQEMKLVELATQFARRGDHATVLYGDMFLDGGERTTAEGVRIVPVNTVMRFPFHPGLLPMAPGLLGHPALLDADVIQVSEFHQPSTFLSCVAAQDPSVPVVLWQETFRHMRFPGSLYQGMYESTVGPYVCRRLQRFVPRTTKAREYLRQLGAAEGRIAPWVPTGIDVNAFAPRAPRGGGEDLEWAGDDPLLLLVGRLHPTKGIDIAIRVLRWVTRRIPNARLMIRGSGPEQAALIRLAQELKVAGSVRIIGRRSRDEMIDLYNRANVVLCTSRTDLMPFSLIEGSACGRPCVATDVGAIRDIVVDGQTGVVVRDPSVEAIGSAVCSLLENEERGMALGAAARRRAEETFALSVVAERLHEVYEDVAA